MNYKNIYQHLFIGALVFLIACSSDSKSEKETSGESSNITFSGKVSNAGNETLLKLIEISPEEVVAIDSSIVGENGEFSFKLNKDYPGFYKLQNGDGSGIPLIIKPGDQIKLTADNTNFSEKYTLEGSEESNLLKSINEILKTEVARIDSLKNIYNLKAEESEKFIESEAATAKPGDKNLAKLKEKLKALQISEKSKLEQLAKSLDKPYQEIKLRMDENIREFVNKHLNSIASLAVVSSLNPEKNMNLYKKLDSILFASFPSSAHVKDFHQRVSKLSLLSSGSASPELDLPGVDGTSIKLSSLKGKYVLVDFWASWCGPCRQENPNNVRLYNQFKNKGFEIYGVSLDKEKAAWLKAIKDDNLNWIHVSDLQQWNSPVVKMFDIEGIPYTLLLDKEGKIIAKGLRGRALELKLKEIFS